MTTLDPTGGLRTPDRLREAAKVVRERADEVLALDANPASAVQNFVAFYSSKDYFPSGGTAGADARYIATMHPGVGLALSDWLDLSARRMDEGLGLPGDYAKGPLRIADLILGSES